MTWETDSKIYQINCKFSVQQQYKGHFDYIMDLEILNETYFVSSNHVDKIQVID